MDTAANPAALTSNDGGETQLPSVDYVSEFSSYPLLGQGR